MVSNMISHDDISPNYKFIYDRDEIAWFYKYAVPRVEEDRVLLWRLSARNKEGTTRNT